MVFYKFLDVNTTVVVPISIAMSYQHLSTKKSLIVCNGSTAINEVLDDMIFIALSHHLHGLATIHEQSFLFQSVVFLLYHYSFLDNAGFTRNSTELSASTFAGKGSS